MAAQDPNEPPFAQPPLAPPTQAGPLPIAPPRSKWPTVLGIIAIVMACLTLLGFVVQMAARFIPHPPSAASQPAVPEPPAIFTAIGMPLWIALAALLLAGGIGLLGRKKWSARTLVIWAIADLVLSVVGLVGTLVTIPSFQEQMRQQNPSAPPMPAGFLQAVFVGSMCVGTLIGLTPPIFALIWFGRRKIKEEVAAWA